MKAQAIVKKSVFTVSLIALLALLAVQVQAQGPLESGAGRCNGVCPAYTELPQTYQVNDMPAYEHFTVCDYTGQYCRIEYGSQSWYYGSNVATIGGNRYNVR